MNKWELLVLVLVLGPSLDFNERETFLTRNPGILGKDWMKKDNNYSKKRNKESSKSRMHLGKNK